MEKLRPRAPSWSKGILIFALVLLYGPLLYMIIGSFSDRTGAFTLKWYEQIFQDLVLQEALVRSLILAAANGVLSVTLGLVAALALEKTPFVAKKLLEFLGLVSLVMPELVFALSLLSWFFILKFELSLATVIMAHVTFSLAFVILTIRSRLNSLDHSVEDAARDLGASEWKLLFSVVLPQLKPTLGTGFILSFLLSFDDFLITFFTSGVGSDTLPVKLYASMKMGHSPKLNALSTLMVVFSVILIAFVVRSKSFKDMWTAKTDKH